MHSNVFVSQHVSFAFKFDSSVVRHYVLFSAIQQVKVQSTSDMLT